MIDVAKKYKDLSQQDPFIYEEIFLVNAYDAHEIEIRDAIVVDIGANIGAFSLLAQEYGAKKVIALEPEKANFDRLTANISKYQANRIKPVMVAVGSEQGKIVYVEGSGGLARTVSTPTGSLGVLTETLPSIFKDIDKKDHVVLKIDCEGAEYDILNEDAIKDILPRVDYIYAELHEIEGQSLSDMIVKIEDSGFDLVNTSVASIFKEDGTSKSHPNKVYKFRKGHKMEVTCIISTKDRYFSTLPHTLVAVCMQTYKPSYLILFDDGEQRDLRGEPLYSHIFSLLDYYGMKDKWQVVFGERKGQVLNHIKSVNMAKTELIWRLDDDTVPEPDVLEKLIKNMGPRVSAVGGLVITSTDIRQKPMLASNKIEDIYLGMNEQWYLHPEGSMPREVDHLYSSFIYRKSIAEYCTELSPVGHREESILTYAMTKKGYANILEPRAKTWHFRNPTGGIRSHTNAQYYANDERVFSRYMNEWGIRVKEHAYVVLDNGIGDHYAFKYWLPEYIERNKDKKCVFFTCFPEVFSDTGITQASIADAKQMSLDLDKYHIYKWMIDNNWKKNLPWAFKQMYQIHGNGTKEKLTREGTGDTIIISPYSRGDSHPKSYPYWTQLAPLLKTTGFRLVQIGVSGDPRLPMVDEFIENQSMREIERLIDGCRIWIGVDNFLQHLCHCRPVTPKGAVLWGLSNPALFGYDYNLNIVKDNGKYFRPDQFGIWGMPRNNDSFCSAEEVFKKVTNTLFIQNSK
jgi:FkbM family methyltransferase